jgi:hypothetical protein
VEKSHHRIRWFIFCVCQFRKGDCSGGGTIFDAQLNQNALDMLADRFGAGAQDHTDLMISFTLGGPS